MNNYYEMDNIKQLYGMKKYINELDNWYNNLKNKYLFVLINGNSGIGKTTLANLYLKHKNYNVIYFDLSFNKNKQNIFNLIKESFNKYHIISYFNNTKKKNAFILDNITNIFFKNDIIELYNLINNNNIKTPVIFIGNYEKTINFPKKKIICYKLYNPTKNTLINISNYIINKYNLNINNITLNIIISKCQNDIRKLHILLFENNNDNDNNNNYNLYKKDIKLNLFDTFSNLVSTYTPINKDDKYLYDNSIILNYIFHQNIFNFLLQNKTISNNNISHYSYLFYKNIYNVLNYNINDILNNCYYSQYIYLLSSKYISYIYNKNKLNKNININNLSIDYPKYSYINNQKNIYKKYINLFKNFDFYYTLNESNFILFCQSLFYEEKNNSYILNKIKYNDIICLKKLILINI